MLINEFPFFSNKECDEIKQYAYKKEKKIIYDLKNVFHYFTEEKFNDFGQPIEEKYNNSVTTNHYNHYNFLKDNPVYADRLVDLLIQTEAPLRWPILVQSWVNIYRKGDGIGWHNHYGSGLSFNIFIDGDPEPGPVYVLGGKDGNLPEYEMETQNYPNKKGVMQIFPSPVYHKVDPLASEEDRITIGGTLHHYSDICRNTLNYLSFNNKKDHGLIVLSNEKT